MASTTFDGPVTSTNGFVGAVTGNVTGNVTGDVTGAVLAAAPVNAAAATLTVTQALHAGRAVTLNRAGGVAVTLPASAGNGAVYRFMVGTSFTTAGTIKVANATDVMMGTALLLQDAADTVVGFATASTSDTITLDGSTTGGLIGAHVVVTDVTAGFFHVHYVSDASGAEATPFSATVS